MLKAKSSEPIPRMKAASTADDPENGVPASRVTFGAMLDRVLTSVTARS